MKHTKLLTGKVNKENVAFSCEGSGITPCPPVSKSDFISVKVVQKKSRFSNDFFPKKTHKSFIVSMKPRENSKFDDSPLKHTAGQEIINSYKDKLYFRQKE